MKVFLTGATGWVGSAVAKELIDSGHQVVGMARSQQKAEELAKGGVKPLLASLEDLDQLHDAATKADAVVHTAFNHDFSKFAENAEQDHQVIETLSDALLGSDRPLLVTSGLLGLNRGATELDVVKPGSPRKSELGAQQARERGLRVATVRLAPSVHGIGDHGFIPILIRIARDTGISAFLGDGSNCWSGVHRLDAARVYRLALEKGVTEVAYHAVADEAIPFKRIAEVIGRQLGLPCERREREHFGWFAHFAGSELSATSKGTRTQLGWAPTGPSLLDDLSKNAYYG